MKKLICLWGLLFVVGLSASAQETSKVDIFGGYSYLRFYPGDSAPAFNLNGGVASLAYNFTDHIAGVAEFGGNHGTLDGFGITSFSYLFGPKFYVKMDKFTPFGKCCSVACMEAAAVVHVMRRTRACWVGQSRMRSVRRCLVT